MGNATINRQGKFVRARIASGSGTSEAVATMGHVIFGAVLPSTLDGTALTFTVSHDGTTYQALYNNDGSTQTSMTVAASRSVDLPTALAAWPYFKLVMGTNQSTTDTDIYIVMKG
jgi:hypothetical protein